MGRGSSVATNVAFAAGTLTMAAMAASLADRGPRWYLPLVAMTLALATASVAYFRARRNAVDEYQPISVRVGCVLTWALVTAAEFASIGTPREGAPMGLAVAATVAGVASLLWAVVAPTEVVQMTFDETDAGG